MKKIYLICFIFLLSSCATMFHGGTQLVKVIPANGETTDVELTNHEGTKQLTIPTTVALKKGEGDVTIKVKETRCHKPSVRNYQERMDLVFLANYFNLSIGSTTDAATGAMWHYDDNMVVPIYRENNCEAK